MTTIINPLTTTEKADGSAGWAVAVIILLVVIAIGAYVWFRYYAPTATNATNNITVVVPSTPTKGTTSVTP